MSRSAQPLVELRSVLASYGPIEVLHGVDLALGAGEVLAVLGPNGAGKTTLLHVLAGLHPLAGGDVILAGRRVNAASATARARAGLCLIPEGRGVFPNLTVRENLRMAAGTARRHGRHSQAPAVEEAAYGCFPKLKDRRRQLAGTLSGGEQQMLALARGLTTDPAVLVLDELSMGLAPLVVEQLYGQVAAMAGRACRCWWSSSSPASSWGWPTGPPCWCRAGWPRSVRPARSSPSCPPHTWVVET